MVASRLDRSFSTTLRDTGHTPHFALALRCRPVVSNRNNFVTDEGAESLDDVFLIDKSATKIVN